METDLQIAPEAHYVSGRRLIYAVAATFFVGALIVILLGRTVHATSQVLKLPPAGTGAAHNFTMPVWNESGAKPFTLSALTGHVVVLNFWAPWCEPCKGEAPVLNAAAKKFAPDGVIFAGVAFQSTQTDTLAFMKQYGVQYPVGPAPVDLDVDFGVTGIPYTFVIAPDGTLVYTFPGSVKADLLATAIRSVEAG